LLTWLALPVVEVRNVEVVTVNMDHLSDTLPYLKDLSQGYTIALSVVAVIAFVAYKVKPIPELHPRLS
jgi:hypothetical protein